MSNDDAIVMALRGDITLASQVKSIGHGLVPPGTGTPYLIVQDLGGDEPEYTFGNHEARSEALYSIEVVATDADIEERSAQSVATEVLNRVHAVLQNTPLPVAGRICMNMIRMGRTGSSWEKGEGDGELYYIDGHRWALTTQPA